jgi:hypothetical protein
MPEVSGRETPPSPSSPTGPPSDSAKPRGV